MACPIQEMLKFRAEAFQKRHLYKEIDALAKNLSEQGVFNAILCITDVDALNRKMQEFIPQYVSPLNSKTGMEYCRNVLVSVVLEKVYEEKGSNASDEDIREAVKNFVQNINWIQTFELLLDDVNNVQVDFYFEPIKQSGVLSNIPEKEQTKLLQLLQSVFALGALDKPAENFKGEYSQYLKHVTMLPESFDSEFKTAAKEYFALRTGLPTQNPFFISQKLRLDINFSKIMMKKAISLLDFENQEISFTTIEKKLSEMMEKRLQYVMLIYVSLMMKGEAASYPMII